MSQLELFDKTLNETMRQLNIVLDKITEERADLKLATKVASPRETIHDLCEAVSAYRAISKGEEFDWGNFKLEDRSIQAMRCLYEEIREECAEIARKKGDTDALSEALCYLSLHESQHIGNLMQFLTQTDPTWNSHCIYSKEATH